MSPFSLRNRSATYSSAPTSLGMLQNYVCTLQSHMGARQNRSPSAQIHPSHPSRCSLQHPSKAEQDPGWGWVLLKGVVWPGGCLEPTSWGLVPGRSTKPCSSMGFISPRDRKGEGMTMPAQSHSCAKQSSLFACIGFSTWTWELRAQQ